MESYRSTMKKLRDPDGWDVEGVIDDIVRRLSDEGDGEAVAVINHLRSQLLVGEVAALARGGSG